MYSETRSFPTAFSSREALASFPNSEPLHQPGRNFFCYLGKADRLPVPSLTLHLQTQEYPFFDVGRAFTLPGGAAAPHLSQQICVPPCQRNLLEMAETARVVSVPYPPLITLH